MRVLTSPDDVTKLDAAEAAVVVARPDDADVIARACQWLCLPPDAAERVSSDAVRPSAFEVDSALVVSLGSVSHDASITALRLVSAGTGLLIVGSDPTVLQRARSVSAAADSTGEALAELLIEVGRISEDNVAAFATGTQQGWDTRSTRLTGVQRRQILSARRALMFVTGVFDAQRRLLDDDGDVASRVGERSVRRLAAARHRFAYVSEMAERLYAAAGDELSQQSTLVTEQLTIVNTVFLPLTLGASFFGMNFGWLTAHIESPLAFVLLGIVLPAVLAVGTVFAMRRLQRQSVDPGG